MQTCLVDATNPLGGSTRPRVSTNIIRTVALLLHVCRMQNSDHTCGNNHLGGPDPHLATPIINPLSYVPQVAMPVISFDNILLLSISLGIKDVRVVFRLPPFSIHLRRL